ncbi:efflux RND transporter periplasmic adaptor subunit [Aliarcobacter butzleri]|uniref:efflux RND transporter periplasmic adaptor subunit n=1 Tax=Aliarcobacter butzleri TaxID=28197 RepID=UPI002B24C49C|nr:efflux RND transporter periplasmic adaptor subunit [Aliarcobacter butzleri]
MTKLITSFMFFLSFAFSSEITLENTEKRLFEKSVEINSKVIQLPSSKQSLMALLDGKIVKYYVKEGDIVKKGDKIALIQSIELSKMSAEYLSLKEQLKSIEENYQGSFTLNKKDIISKQELNLLNIQRKDISSKLETVISQLKTLDIDVKDIKNTISEYVLFSQNSGIVSSLLKTEYSAVTQDTEIVTIVKANSFYLKSYLPVAYSEYLKVGQKISTNFNGKNIISYIEKILPELDETTQRIIVLSNIEDEKIKLYPNLYLGSTLYYDTDKEYIAVKKTALSFLNNEWVIFVPDEEKTKHEQEEKMFKPLNIKIIQENDEYVAVDGVEENQKYVSDEPYKVKSIILKSSLSEGH